MRQGEMNKSITLEVLRVFVKCSVVVQLRGSLATLFRAISCWTTINPLNLNCAQTTHPSYTGKKKKQYFFDSNTFIFLFYCFILFYSLYFHLPDFTQSQCWVFYFSNVDFYSEIITKTFLDIY